MDDAENLIFGLLLILIPVIVFFSSRRFKFAARIAFTLLALLMAAYVLPGWFPARETAAQNACVNNLRLIKEAKAEWARVNYKLPSDVPTDADLIGTNKFLLHSVPVCPSGGTYIFGAVNVDPKCSLTDHGHKLP